MKPVRNALILAAAILGARVASATTLNLLIHGNSCTSITPGNAPVYTQFGPYNSSTTTALDLNCPITFPSHNYTSGYMLLYGWPRNSADAVFCNYASTDTYGNNRSLVKAIIPYSNGAANFAQVNLSALNAGVPYVTCHLPVATAAGKSYLSSFYIEATY